MLYLGLPGRALDATAVYGNNYKHPILSSKCIYLNTNLNTRLTDRAEGPI